MGLILHAGAHAVTRDDVHNTPTPDPYDQTYPIPHGWFLDKVESNLERHGWHITEAAYGLQKGEVPQDSRRFHNGNITTVREPQTFEGNRFFAFLRVEHADNPIPGVEKFCLGLRNSFDHAFSATVMAGSHVTVCDNLLMQGGNMIKARRKNTRYIRRDLPGIIGERFGALMQDATDLRERTTRFIETPLKDHEANDLMIQTLREGCVPSTRFHQVVEEWYRPDGVGGYGDDNNLFLENSVWKLQQAFTEVQKHHPTQDTAKRNTRLLNVLNPYTLNTTT